MTVHDHLQVAARATASPADVAITRAQGLGLGPWLDKNAGHLSTGNIRKLWYVMCTLGRFSIVCLDEPFLGLDEVGVEVVCNDVTAWSASRSVVLVSHELPDGLDVRHRCRLFATGAAAAAPGPTRSR
jgi:ABC-type multidrug transport system ATPase subunit